MIGNLGADLDVRHTQTGTTVSSFNIATTRRWKDQFGQQQEQTEWHRIVAFGRLGEICSEYLSKGIESRLQTRKQEDKDGNQSYKTEIVASEMKMLDSKLSKTGVPEPSDSSPFLAGDDEPFRRCLHI
ncbi:MAG: single-stranded DNA-binding protein [Desulfobulbaceae bacterium]|nr:MAG: single-stranded DNA-binding protein [Desulfobulbaceae bacterium]